ncbi:hypothetical protein E4U32_002237 [Claviceps aff. humidiphila group G2b]|nr:hypothetical protein E4U32_002237 [Claviceps aff. humidiphila group G2b]
MEASPYEGILKSPTFKFVVGEAKEELFLYSALVASKSEVLGKMINGPFIEGQQGYVTLADEDVRTITAFAEFAFTGDYQIKLDTSEKPGGRPHRPRPGDPDDADRVRVLERPSNTHWEMFTLGKEYGNFGSSTNHKILSDPKSVYTSHSRFLIAHAKIFIFADCYGVAGLLDLAMQKLHKALCGFQLSLERIGDILDLVRFCYERPCPDKLKRLVASYSAAIVDSRGKNVAAECFRGLMKERGDFAADMAWFMACRLTGFTEC